MNFFTIVCVTLLVSLYASLVFVLSDFFNLEKMLRTDSIFWCGAACALLGMLNFLFADRSTYMGPSIDPGDHIMYSFGVAFASFGICFIAVSIFRAFRKKIWESRYISRKGRSRESAKILKLDKRG